jgi:[acyl-carrier-protein] S-malonyltransferase
VLSFGDAVRAVHARGQFMQEAVPAGEGAMAAVLGLSPGAVADVCAEARAETGAVVAPANLNAPEQTVISGSASGVARAGELAKAAGAKRVVMLQVSAPFHCALMQPAQDRLAALLAGVEFCEARVPVVVNVDACAVREGARLREALVRQVTGAVRWVESMGVVLAGGPVLAVEVGPAKVLSGLMRQMDRGQAMVNVEDSASLAKVLEALAS